jgi:MFS family permease
VSNENEHTYPSARMSWSMVALLTIAYVLSFVDRSIIGLLIEPIKADLKITDVQAGYLMGIAFALFYGTIGVPLGWLADRKRRTWIVAAGIAIWSLATAASGLARSFSHLFVARMAIGAGEAALSPCAMSMIGDSFPPEKRGKPVAVYSAALALGSGIASLIGAAVLTWANTADGITLPLVGAVKPWQFAFFIVGLPGVLLAIAFLFVKEPPRQKVEASAGLRASGFGDMFGYIWERRGAFLGLIFLVCVMTITAYGQGFNASAFVRKFGWAPEKYALVNGIITLAIGPAIVTAMGILCDYWRKSGQDDAPFYLLSFGFVIMILGAATGLLMPNPVLALTVLTIGAVGMAAVTTTGIITLLDITPAAIRGQVVAIYYMLISITGLSIGPTAVGWLSTKVFGEANLHYASSAVPALFGTIGILLIPFVGNRYRVQRALVNGDAPHDGSN